MRAKLQRCLALVRCTLRVGVSRNSQDAFPQGFFCHVTSHSCTCTSGYENGAVGVPQQPECQGRPASLLQEEVQQKQTFSRTEAVGGHFVGKCPIVTQCPNPFQHKSYLDQEQKSPGTTVGCGCGQGGLQKCQPERTHASLAWQA
eukprot:5394499-Amphidinium_carterae.1